MTTFTKDYNSIDGTATVHTKAGTRELYCQPCAEYVANSFPTTLDGAGRYCDACGEAFKKEERL